MFDIDRQTWVRQGAVVAAVAAVCALVSLPGLVVVPVVGPLDLGVGLAVPLGVVAGPPAAVGVGVGLAVGGAVTGLSWWLALDAVAYGGLAYVGWRLWGVLPGLSTRGRFRAVRASLAFAAVALVAAMTVAAALAWVSLLVWESPFHAVAIPELTLVVVSTAVLAPVVLTVAAATATERRQPTDFGVTPGGFLGGVLAPLAWFVLGSAGSLATVPRWTQTVLGAVALALVVATYLPSNRQLADGFPTATDQ